MEKAVKDLHFVWQEKSSQAHLVQVPPQIQKYAAIAGEAFSLCLCVGSGMCEL